jgi:ABC-type glutathione transport system ATPase component
MVKLIVGKKGSGKTKKIINLANDSLEIKGGSIVFINKDNRTMYELKHDIRMISMDEYEELTNSDEYIGFLYGIISADHDVEMIFIDSILKQAHIKLENLPKFLDRLNIIAKKYNIEFVVSISADVSDLSGIEKEYEFIN